MGIGFGGKIIGPWRQFKSPQALVQGFRDFPLESVDTSGVAQAAHLQRCVAFPPGNCHSSV